MFNYDIRDLYKAIQKDAPNDSDIRLDNDFITLTYSDGLQNYPELQKVVGIGFEKTQSDKCNITS